jgi:hypothetical protein
VGSAENPALLLAQRLRTLRVQGWPGLRITQRDIATALGASPPSVSSWESQHNGAVPPSKWLEAYATFFATERSVATRPFRVLRPAQLTAAERARRDELLRELTGLRDGAGDGPPTSHWRFGQGEDVVIVCSQLPPRYRNSLPCADPREPGFASMYRYADLDALMEVHGHLRAANPANNVAVRSPEALQADDVTSHLVLLGGVDWKTVTQDVLRSLDVPLERLQGGADEPGGFEMDLAGERRTFVPVLGRTGRTLVEDVALFYRAPNPWNGTRTVTICTGSYPRGTYGAVRALTDARFRDRNERYLRTRFTGRPAFWVISRVSVILGEVVTPDWTNSEYLLHEWPVGTA